MHPSPALSLVLVGCGGALGSMARYLLGSAIMQASHQPGTARFPLGTLCVNLLGCLLIGLLAGTASRFDWLSPALRLLLVTGVLGGFTTFSAFGLESIELIQRQQWLAAAAYIGASVVLGLLAVWLGQQTALLGLRG